MKFRVHYTDGRTAEADEGARVHVDAERRFDRSWPELWRGSMRHEHFYFVAWRALVRGGQEPAADFDDSDAFDAWLDGVATAEIAGLPDGQDDAAADGAEASEGDASAAEAKPSPKSRRRAAPPPKDRPTRQAQ